MVSPTELVRSFMEFSYEKGRTNFPPLFYGTRPWHEFLYELKKQYKNRFPELKCIGDFDWDDPYPTAPVWHEIQTSLCLLQVCGSRVGNNRSFLYRESIRGEIPVLGIPVKPDKVSPELLEVMFRVAMETNNFFENAD